MKTRNGQNTPKYLTSRYNIGYNKGDYSFLFNTRSGAFLRLKTMCNGAFNQIVSKKPVPIDGDIMSSNVFKDLKAGGFIIDDDFDELESIKYFSKLRTYTDSRRCTLVLLPTLACNMRCKYCFEKHKPQMTMSKKVQRAIVDYVRNRLMDGCKVLHIEWFGGEPLLEFSVIRTLSHSLMKLCRLHDAKYTASMISNGTLLTRQVAIDLKKLNVQSVQITLDGPPHIHNERRPFKNGSGTFDVILKNISDSCRIINLTIRSNIDKDNVNDAKQLCDLLVKQNIAPHVRLYFSPVHSGAEGCADAKHCRGTYSEKSFAPIEIRLKSMISSNGFREIFVLNPTYSSCGATGLSGFVVDPDGQLHKCQETVGINEEVVGTIFKGPKLNNTFFKWVNYSALDSKKCLNCKVLPQCMGWCPIQKRKDPTVGSCHRYRFNIINNLELTYRNKAKTECAICRT